MITYQREEMKSTRVGNFPTIEALYATIPREVREHCGRVSDYAVVLYRYIYNHYSQYIPDLRDNEFYNNSPLAFRLHDMGRAYVPVRVLNKAGGLTEEEYALVKRHAELGEAVFASIYNKPFSTAMRKKIVDIATCHHERWDGGGYPYGLSGDQIPTGARICAIVDAFDGMVSWKAYRAAMPVEKAVEIIQAESGKQFDPALVRYFNECYKRFPKEDV